MKIAESWLREWVDPALSTEELAHQLTMLGHEVDSLHVEGEGIEDVVIAPALDFSAELAVLRHPQQIRAGADDGGAFGDDVVGAPYSTSVEKLPEARICSRSCCGPRM